MTNRRCLELTARAKVPTDLQSRPGREVRFFGSGRAAVVALIRGLRDQRSRVALLPAVVPEGLYAPVVAAGWEAVFYRVDRALDPDWDDLEDLLKRRRPDLAFLIHYFGLAKDASRFTNMCRAHGVLAVEDLAHAYQGEDDGGPLGRHGDVALYSLPKMIGVPDGGVLVINGQVERIGSLCATPGWRHKQYAAQVLVYLIAATLGQHVPGRWGEPFSTLVARVIGGNPYKTLMSSYCRPAPMTTMSWYLLHHLDHERVRVRRRALARIYSEGLDRMKVTPFPGADRPAAVMMGYPVTVADRPALARRLCRHGIAGVCFVDRWCFLPHEVCGRHQDAQWVLDHHYLLPLHQRLRDDQAARVVAVVNASS